MPGIFVARPAGGHLKEVLWCHSPTKLSENSWNAGAFSIASVVGATQQILSSCCAASVRDPTLVGEPNPRFCVTGRAAECSPSIDVRCFAPILPFVPFRLLIFTPKLNQLDARTSPIFQAGRGNFKGPRRRGMSCFGCSLVERRRPVQGWGLFRAVFGPPPPGRLDDELHDEGCSIVPLRSPDPTSIMGPPGTRPPVSGPRIRNPEDSWRLACLGHSKRCRQKLRLTAHHQGKQHIKTMPIPLPRDPTRDSTGFSKRTTPSALFVYQG